jgi:hypothetical protein
MTATVQMTLVKASRNGAKGGKGVVLFGSLEGGKWFERWYPAADAAMAYAAKRGYLVENKID